MSDKLVFQRTRSPALRLAGPLGAVLALSMLSGCAWFDRHHVTVGAVPDDYRTNHPIVLAENQETFDVPVAAGEDELTIAQRGPVQGFISNYVKNGAGAIQIVTPVGSPNEVSASRVGGQLAGLMRERGISPSKIAFASYQVTSPEAAAPVHLSYTGITASVGRCGRWPEDLNKNAENKHYANFGCSYQNNLAAQVANPSDLLGPREQGEIDAANRSAVIDIYQNPEPLFIPELEY